MNISDEALSELEKSNPELVAQYRAKMSGPTAGVRRAEIVDAAGSMVNVAGKAFTDYQNSKNSDVVLHNRMQDLGSVPTVKAAAKNTYDGSAVSEAAERFTANAKNRRAEADNDFWNEEKLKDRSQALEYGNPKSEKSKAYQQTFRSLLPEVATKMGDSLDKMSANDLEKNFPKLAAVFAKTGASGKALGKASDWQILSMKNPDGSNSYINYNKLTDERKPIEGIKGYAPKFVKDPYSGQWKQIAPGSSGGVSAEAVGQGGGSASSGGGSEPGPKTGETPYEYKLRREREEAHAKKQDEVDLKESEAIQDAEASQAIRARVMEEMIGLYDGASKEGNRFFDGTGPLDGRISELQNAVGMSAGPNTDKLIARSATSLADYIKDRSGTAASEGEIARLKKVMPSVSDDRQLFINKMHAGLEEAEKILAERQAKTGKIQQSDPKPAASGTDQKIDSFMRKNGIKDRNEAIRILKENGRI